MIVVGLLNDKDYELYKKAELEVSNEHLLTCVCGRLCTGLHERTCKKFKESVERRFLRLKKKEEK